MVASPGAVLGAGQVARVAVVRKRERDAGGAGGADLDRITAGRTTIGATIDSIELGDGRELDKHGGNIERAMRADYVASKKRQRSFRDLERHHGASAPGTPRSPAIGTLGGTAEWTEVRLYVDGREVASATLPATSAGTNGQPLVLGKAYGEANASGIRGTQASFLEGTLGEVRLWSRGLPASELGQNLAGGEQGLAACWTFDENEGNTTSDRVGGHHAVISGARWTPNPDPNGPRLTLLVGGMPAEVESIAAPDSPADQFSVGRGFQGLLDEVRVWRTARTGEQILDNLFTRLRGEREDIVAYYTFDRTHGRSDDRVLDAGLRGALLEAAGPAGEKKIAYTFSTAPIGQDVALVRNALAGIETDFQDVAEGRLGAVEYGDLQYAASGQLVGAHKRCYTFAQHGAWQLVTGFKVGNIITEWIGQAQFDPQVMGFIEGAPPVPGENLTAGPIDPAREDYTGAATLEVVEADEVAVAVDASREGSFDTSLAFSASLGAAQEMLLIKAPLDLGVGIDAFQASVEAAVSGQFETSAAWSSAESLGHGKNRSRTTSVALGGFWEDPTNPIVPDAFRALGRRFVPGNTGFAVVTSETADIYALRLAHTGTLVALRFRPNRDIPRDVNLLPFPINPHYTKQGTLDGALGYGERGKIVDPDYPNARGQGAYSYFKPREAYGLRRRIRQQEQELLSFYENFHPSPFNRDLGRISKASTEAIGGASDAEVRAALDRVQDLPRGATDPVATRYAKRNLVNTYLWTAEGGFYAEETETSDVQQETVGSSFSLAGSVGGGIGASFDVLGATLSLEASVAVGGSFTTTKSKTKNSKRTFGLEVTSAPPGNLQRYDAQGNPVFDAEGRPVQAPGKVDAYRFMTFYLEPDPQHFDALFNRVVDPLWLAQSDHPNAAALRQAGATGKRPPCWRVFHRVTFVSRILPPFPDETAPPLDRALMAAHLASNWELIRRLDPLVRSHAGDLGAFGLAVREALRRHLPELQPHAHEITEYLAL